MANRPYTAHITKKKFKHTTQLIINLDLTVKLTDISIISINFVTDIHLCQSYLRWVVNDIAICKPAICAKRGIYGHFIALASVYISPSDTNTDDIDEKVKCQWQHWYSFCIHIYRQNLEEHIDYWKRNIYMRAISILACFHCFGYSEFYLPKAFPLYKWKL
jgi:hypothetical protein